MLDTSDILTDLTSLLYVDTDKGDDAHCQLYSGSHLSLVRIWINKDKLYTTQCYIGHV